MNLALLFNIRRDVELVGVNGLLAVRLQSLHFMLHLHCLLFIGLFAIKCTKQKKIKYLSCHGGEAQEKPPGL